MGYLCVGGDSSCGRGIVAVNRKYDSDSKTNHGRSDERICVYLVHLHHVSDQQMGLVAHRHRFHCVWPDNLCDREDEQEDFLETESVWGALRPYFFYISTFSASILYVTIFMKPMRLRIAKIAVAIQSANCRNIQPNPHKTTKNPRASTDGM